MTVVDLGAAPGGWTLVAVQAVRGDKSVPWRLPSHVDGGSAAEADPSASPPGEHQDKEQHPQASRRPDTQSPEADSRRGARRSGRVVSCDLLAMTPVTPPSPQPQRLHEHRVRGPSPSFRRRCSTSSTLESYSGGSVQPQRAALLAGIRAMCRAPWTAQQTGVNDSKRLRQ